MEEEETERRKREGRGGPAGRGGAGEKLNVDHRYYLFWVHPRAWSFNLSSTGICCLAMTKEYDRKMIKNVSFALQSLVGNMYLPGLCFKHSIFPLIDISVFEQQATLPKLNKWHFWNEFSEIPINSNFSTSAYIVHTLWVLYQISEILSRHPFNVTNKSKPVCSIVTWALINLFKINHPGI